MSILPNATPGDAEKARTARLVQATRYDEEHPGALTPEQRDAVAAWILTGDGPPPWETPPPYGGQTYPPATPQGGPRA